MGANRIATERLIKAAGGVSLTDLRLVLNALSARMTIPHTGSPGLPAGHWRAIRDHLALASTPTAPSAVPAGWVMVQTALRDVDVANEGCPVNNGDQFLELGVEVPG